MKTILALALVCVSVQLALAAPSDKIDCSKIDEVLDDLGGAQGLTLLNDKYPLATTLDLHTKRCGEMSEAIKTLRKYNKECYSSLTQQVFSAMLRTRNEFTDKRCKDPASDSYKQGFEALKCIATEAIEPTREAEKKIILGMQVLYDANIADEKLRIRRACCNVIDAKKIFVDASKSKCAKHEPVYGDYVDSYTQEAMGLICPATETLDCAKLEALKLDGVEPKYKSYLNPILKLVKTLDH